MLSVDVKKAVFEQVKETDHKPFPVKKFSFQSDWVQTLKNSGPPKLTNLLTVIVAKF